MEEGTWYATARDAKNAVLDAASIERRSVYVRYSDKTRIGFRCSFAKQNDNEEEGACAYSAHFRVDGGGWVLSRLIPHTCQHLAVLPNTHGHKSPWVATRVPTRNEQGKQLPAQQIVESFLSTTQQKDHKKDSLQGKSHCQESRNKRRICFLWPDLRTPGCNKRSKPGHAYWDGSRRWALRERFLSTRGFDKCLEVPTSFFLARWDIFSCSVGWCGFKFNWS